MGEIIKIILKNRKLFYDHFSYKHVVETNTNISEEYYLLLNAHIKYYYNQIQQLPNKFEDNRHNTDLMKHLIVLCSDELHTFLKNWDMYSDVLKYTLDSIDYIIQDVSSDLDEVLS